MTITQNSQLANLVLKVVKKAVQKVFVALPGKVESYDPATGRADVQPESRDAEIQADGSLSSRKYPKLFGVPVLQLYGQKGGLIVPVSAGDTVALVFARHSLSRWSEKGGQIDPADTRIEGMTGAFAIAGLRPSSAVSDNASADNVVLFGDQIRVGSDNASSPVVLGDQYDIHQHMTAFGLSSSPVQTPAGSHTSSKINVE